MAVNPITIATQGKGLWNTLKRTSAIGRRYGLTPHKMDRMLAHIAGLLAEYHCSATFPVTSATLARNKGIVEKHQARHIEFAVHGYYHVDHKRLSLDEQVAHCVRARRLFEARGLVCHGFRCPYLRWNEDTLAALRQTGLLYDSSQVIAWNVAGELETDTYRRVLEFCGAVPASAYPVLPRRDRDLVRIPYCIPDDEVLIDRMQFSTAAELNQPWLAILEETYRRGELFTLGLHPERIHLCEAPLIATLRAARERIPAVWMARLDEIARWWIDRTETVVAITDMDEREIRVDVRGPEGTTVLVRNLAVNAPSKSWDGIYRQVNSLSFTFQAAHRPFIGVSPASSPDVTSFLRQQGYIVEQATADRMHSLYVNRPLFGYEDEWALLDLIEKSDVPLVRLGRWPHGARSALCVTGDIDALTIWDYGLRFLGN